MLVHAFSVAFGRLALGLDQICVDAMGIHEKADPARLFVGLVSPLPACRRLTCTCQARSPCTTWRQGGQSRRTTDSWRLRSPTPQPASMTTSPTRLPGEQQEAGTGGWVVELGPSSFKGLVLTCRHQQRRRVSCCRQYRKLLLVSVHITVLQLAQLSSLPPV